MEPWLSQQKCGSYHQPQLSYLWLKAPSYPLSPQSSVLIQAFALFFFFSFCMQWCRLCLQKGTNPFPSLCVKVRVFNTQCCYIHSFKFLLLVTVASTEVFVPCILGLRSDRNTCQVCPFCRSSGLSFTLQQTPLHPQLWSEALTSDHSCDTQLLNRS